MLPSIDNNYMDSAEHNSLPRELTERFKILKYLGQGGLSSVFLVEDRTRPGFSFALKILKANKIQNDNLARFKDEFEVLKNLQHPNLIKAFELIELKGSIAYLMEYVEGKNLLEVLKSRTIPHNEIDQIFSQLLSALHLLHEKGLAHRDIKLENVLIRENGHVKLSDLGLMKNLTVSDATEAGILLGTSQYLPPEYVRHNVYDFRSDIYATGLMLFECLVGKRWLSGKKGAKAIRYLCSMNFEFPKLALVGLPFKYQRILETALSVKPWKRYKSAKAMSDAILSDNGDIKRSTSVEVSEHLCIKTVHERRRTTEFRSIRDRRRKIIWGAAGLVAASGLIIMIGMAGLDSQPPPSKSHAPIATVQQLAPIAISSPDLEKKSIKNNLTENAVKNTKSGLVKTTH